MRRHSMLAARTQAYLRQDFIDAEEEVRVWRLRCVQAEAELRALRGQACRASGCVAGDASGDQCSPEAPSGTDAQTILSQVLAWEKHIDELEAWRAHVQGEASRAREQATSLETRFEEECSVADLIGKRAKASTNQANALTDHRNKTLAKHEALCSELQLEARSLLRDAGSQDDLRPELERVQAAAQELSATVTRFEAEADAAQQDRERLWMRREEVRTRRWFLVDAHSQSLRDTAAAQQAIQLRRALFGRIQGDVMRNRSKNERRRRLLDADLTKCRGELADSVARADVQAEQLRKVKQQHGRQLRELRAQTDGLQQEVDDRLRSIEDSEEMLVELRAEGVEMERSRDQHVGEERALEEQAESLQVEAARLEQEVATSEVDLSNARDTLADMEAEHSELLRQTVLTEEQTQAATERCEEAGRKSNEIRAELEEARASSGAQYEEVAKLQSLEEQARLTSTRNDQLSEQHLQQKEALRQAERGLERHVSDLQEAVRRIARLKASHAELLEVFPSSGPKGTLPGSMDQAIGRVTKKAEAVLLYLENRELGPRKQPSVESQIANSQRGQTALHRRLRADAERHLEATLKEERRVVLLEQQRSLEEVWQRTAEQQRLRQERRRLEEELESRRRAFKLARLTTESELNRLRAQVLLVKGEAVEGAQAVTAEFSDLLQKQALERDLLQRQVDELRRERHGVATKDDELDEQEEILPTKQLHPRLLDAEAEVEALRLEEEQLLEAHVKLKAAVIAARQHEREEQERDGQTHLSHGIDASEASQEASNSAACAASIADASRDEGDPTGQVSAPDRPLENCEAPSDGADGRNRSSSSPAPVTSSPKKIVMSHSAPTSPAQALVLPVPALKASDDLAQVDVGFAPDRTHTHARAHTFSTPGSSAAAPTRGPAGSSLSASIRSLPANSSDLKGGRSGSPASDHGGQIGLSTSGSSPSLRVVHRSGAPPPEASSAQHGRIVLLSGRSVNSSSTSFPAESMNSSEPPKAIGAS